MYQIERIVKYRSSGWRSILILGRKRIEGRVTSKQNDTLSVVIGMVCAGIAVLIIFSSR